MIADISEQGGGSESRRQHEIEEATKKLSKAMARLKALAAEVDAVQLQIKDAVTTLRSAAR